MSLVKLVGLALVGLTLAMLWFGFWTGAVVYFCVLLLLVLVLVSKPSHELPPAS